MIPYERRRIMLAELEKSEIVSLQRFCEVLGDVSESTVRRDLRTLEEEGLLVNLRGGAATMVAGSNDTPVSSRSILNVYQKELIAKTAAGLVNDGDVIYLDNGSTVGRMVKYLEDKHISIVTTDVLIIQDIASTNLNATLVGGDIIKQTSSLVGPMTDTILRGLFFDKAFLGTFGYDLQAGINSPDYREVNKKQIVKANSREVYVLADHSKEGRRSLCKASVSTSARSLPTRKAI